MLHTLEKNNLKLALKEHIRQSIEVQRLHRIFNFDDYSLYWSDSLLNYVFLELGVTEDNYEECFYDVCRFDEYLLTVPQVDLDKEIEFCVDLAFQILTVKA